MLLKPSTVLMVPPDGFQFNTETAASNSFQSTSAINNIGEKAQAEFANMVSKLKECGIRVIQLKQNEHLPDAVFPNNWFSTHINDANENILIVYPMLAKNRQQEVNIDGLINIITNERFKPPTIIDLRNNEQDILEGTGSLVLDREYRILYAALSPRTKPVLVNKVARLLGYQSIVFTSVDEQQRPIYHTNVIMSLARNYVIICLDSLNDLIQRSAILQSFALSNKSVIEISQQQVKHMCGNTFELINNKGESILVLSAQALKHFKSEQLEIIQRYSQLVPVDIETIETIGGGSARCMMAEINFV